MSAETDRLASLIRQLQGALGGLSIRMGHVTAAGAVDVGTGVGVTKNGTGDFTLTFDPPFTSNAQVVAMLGTSAAGIRIPKEHASNTPSPSSFRIATITTAAVLADADFWFIAAG